MRPEVENAGANRGWKQLVADGLYQSGLLQAFHGFSQRYELAARGTQAGRLRRVQKAKYVVLGYHRVGTDGVPFYCTLPQSVFAEQMRYLARNYRLLSIEQMASELKDPNAQGQAVAVTFDDGYLGTFTEAFPVLQQYQVPVTVYLTAGAIESGEAQWYDRIFLQFQKAGDDLNLMLAAPRSFRLNSYLARIEAATETVTYLRSVPDEQRQAWCREFDRLVPLKADALLGAMMTWEQARLMEQAGVSFGAHTMSHPVASRLAPDVLRKEVSASKAMIEDRLQHSVDDFAFPFGKSRDCGNHGREMFASMGFRSAITTIVGVNEPGADLFRLRRLVIGNDTSMARFALQLHQLFFHPVDEELSVA